MCWSWHGCDKSPNLYLDELQEMMAATSGVRVSRSTVWRTLQRAGYTMKKVRFIDVVLYNLLYGFSGDPCCGRTVCTKTA